MTEQEKKMWQDDLDMISKLNREVDELNKRIDKAIEVIENSYYSKNTTDIDNIVFTTNKLLQIRNILKGGNNE